MTLDQMDWNYRYRHAEFFGTTARENSRLGMSEGIHRIFGHEYPYSGDKTARQATAARETALEQRAANTVIGTPALVYEAAGWLIDAFSLDPDLEEDWTPKTMVRIIHKKYSGGIVQFYMDTRCLAPVITRKK